MFNGAYYPVYSNGQGQGRAPSYENIAFQSYGGVGQAGGIIPGAYSGNNNSGNLYQRYYSYLEHENQVYPNQLVQGYQLSQGSQIQFAGNQGNYFDQDQYQGHYDMPKGRFNAQQHRPKHQRSNSYPFPYHRYQPYNGQNRPTNRARYGSNNHQFWNEDGRSSFQRDNRQTSGSGTYSPQEISHAKQILEYNTSQPKYSEFLLSIGVTVRGRDSDISFHPNPQWHGAVEDYEKRFFPYGGFPDQDSERGDSNSELPHSSTTDDSSEKNPVSTSQGKHKNSTPNSATDATKFKSDVVQIDSSEGSSDSSKPKENKKLNVVEVDSSSDCASDVNESNDKSKSKVVVEIDSSSSSISDTTKNCGTVSISSDTESDTPTPASVEPPKTSVFVSKGTVIKCDFCDFKGDEQKMKTHLIEKKHHSASSYHFDVEDGEKLLVFVDVPLKIVNNPSLNETLSVLCPICPHEVFENTFVCAAHCDALHEQPNIFATSEVVWKGKCEVYRTLECKKCSQKFPRMQKLNNHWRQNVDHFPSNLGQYMNNDHILFFFCDKCSTKHYDFFFMNNHVVHCFSDKNIPTFSALVLENKKSEHSFPPIKRPFKYVQQHLENLCNHTKHLHGAKSQAVKMVRDKWRRHLLLKDS